MKYRHVHHAGNFADVHKHVTLLALLAAMQRKPKGFFHLDTHAGRGQYELPAHAVHESDEGISRLLAAAGAVRSAELHAYLDAVRRVREGRGGRARSYPGSAALALASLREADRALFVEAQHEEFLALRALVERGARSPARALARHGDGYAALASELPPIERRALVLVDPPFEDSRAELRQLVEGVRSALRRLASAVLAIWYPLKLERDAQHWRHVLDAAAAPAPILFCELRLFPLDSRVGLNGSALAIVNPPWQIASRMREWLPELAVHLGAQAAPSERASVVCVRDSD